jgi:hypothetical protein
MEGEGRIACAPQGANAARQSQHGRVTSTAFPPSVSRSRAILVPGSPHRYRNPDRYLRFTCYASDLSRPLSFAILGGAHERPPYCY